MHLLKINLLIILILVNFINIFNYFINHLQGPIIQVG